MFVTFVYWTTDHLLFCISFIIGVFRSSTILDFLAIMTTKKLLGSEDFSVDIRDEVRKTLEVNNDILDTLVAKVKQTLIDELTDVITKKVADALKDTYEFELAERDQKISALEKKVDDLEMLQDDAEQYSRRNCLVVHGLVEKKDESTDDLLKKFCKDRLDVIVEDSEIDRSHRLGMHKKDKIRGIIIRFSNYNTRNAVYQKRKVLRKQEKQPIVYVQENLTKERANLFWNIKKNYKEHIKSIWTQDGRVKVITVDDRRVTLTRMNHISTLVQTSS